MKNRGLPEETAARLSALRAADDPQWKALALECRQRGYSLGEIAKAAGVSRQRVHAVTKAKHVGRFAGPGAPPKVPGYPSTRTGGVCAADAAVIKGLWIVSQARRGSTSPDSVPAEAHRQLVERVVELIKGGVPLDVLADAIDADRGTFRGRMLRAGVTRKGVQG